MTYLMGIENSFIKFESGFSDDSYFKQFFSFHLGRNMVFTVSKLEKKTPGNNVSFTFEFRNGFESWWSVSWLVTAEHDKLYDTVSFV